MNGFPQIDPRAAERAQRTMQAREQVRTWVNAMKERQLSACMFSLLSPLTDDFSLSIGAIDHELDAAGYTIVSHSHAVLGKQGEAFLVSLTLLVRAKGDAPKVLLA